MTPVMQAEHAPPVRWSFVLVVLAALPGCALVPGLAPRFELPEAWLAASKVESLSPLDVGTVLTLSIFNPNDQGLRVYHLRYRLRLHDTTVAEDAQRLRLELPPHVITSLEIPLSIQWQAIQGAAPAAFSLGEVPYELETWLSVGSLLARREIRSVDRSALRLDVPLGLARLRPVALACSGWQTYAQRASPVAQVTRHRSHMVGKNQIRPLACSAN